MRRRRGFKGTWFPINSETFVEGPDDPIEAAPLQGTQGCGTGATGAETTFRILTYDQPGEDSFLINDILGQEYALRRIVGKLHLWWQDTTNGATPQDLYTAQIAAGFFVARAGTDPNDLPEGAVNNSVTSFITGVDTFKQYSPMSAGAIREPWIWRRTWVLGNPPASDGNLTQTRGVLPVSNIDYGSVLDGPHIDAKTRRRIRQDERLFFVMTGRMLDGGGGTVSLNFNWTLDVRLFGALRKARNKGAF